MKVFVSSTFADLADHRDAVNAGLLRMKMQFSAMEYFGSRGDEAGKVCFDEIDKSDILIGIYAWRYGWQPSKDEPSITEQEFDYARSVGKNCFCYVVDENYPWIPLLIDKGESGERLSQFKLRVSRLVRSRFTTPDNLASQVVADLAREISDAPPKTLGGLLSINWDVLSPELQIAFLRASAVAKVKAKDGIIATEHLLGVLSVDLNTARPLVTGFPDVKLPGVPQNVGLPLLEEGLANRDELSHCVFGSLQRLLPAHSPTQRLLAIELAADILKNGRGKSVQAFRDAGVGPSVVDLVYRHIREVADDKDLLFRGIDQLSDAELATLTFAVGIPLATVHGRIDLERVLRVHVSTQEGAIGLAGELIRRHSRLIGL